MSVHTIRELRATIEAIERDAALFETTNFKDRAEALDFLEFDVFERIEGLVHTEGCEAFTDLKQYAERVSRQLEGVHEALFRKLREEIASGNSTGGKLKQQLLGYASDGSANRDEREVGYDSLDALVSGLLLAEAAPEAVRQREPEMVFYQPTPARIVLEMVEKTDFQQEDVFYDIGSGLGQVAILVHLLTGVRSKGVEIEPAYCEYARRCACRLNLSRVTFTNQDAREVDYTEGTLFFMYTPFEGKVLEQVLGQLETQSKKRRIQLYTYGPCTRHVGRQKWLARVDQNGDQENRLAIFRTSEWE